MNQAAIEKISAYIMRLQMQERYYYDNTKKIISKMDIVTANKKRIQAAALYKYYKHNNIDTLLAEIKTEYLKFARAYNAEQEKRTKQSWTTGIAGYAGTDQPLDVVMDVQHWFRDNLGLMPKEDHYENN